MTQDGFGINFLTPLFVRLSTCINLMKLKRDF
jgi:hypothetical protein